MRARFKYNLFDLDGTLTDPALGITNSVIYALERVGIEPPPREALYKYIGPPLVYSFRTYAGMDEETAVKALTYYRERFSAGGMLENEIYPGIAALLADIRAGGGRVILATGKPEEFAAKILEHFDILRYFDFVAGNTLEEKRPEKRDVFRHIIANMPEIGQDGDNVVMVGDREYDILAAKEFSFRSAGVLFGFGSEEELRSAGADMIAATVAELRGLLIEDGKS
ncbi:MAG: HAD hydrolase-like protein [Clostridia bacterium]|nr:HAD hydrolase-like protein [Clostridia bacterium]MBR6006007.1 HAD hydrolase-like protein [Clostridia bacterium]